MTDNNQETPNGGEDEDIVEAKASDAEDTGKAKATTDEPGEGTAAGEAEDAGAEPGKAEEGSPDDEEARQKRRDRRQRSKEAKRAALDALERIKGAGSGDEPKEGDFDDYVEFVAAKAVWRSQESGRTRELTAAEAEAKAADAAEREAYETDFREQVAAAKLRHKDFEAVAFRQDMHVSPDLAAMVKSSDQGAELAYYLGKNPETASRISTMSAVEAAREVGRIEARLSSPPPPRKTTTAPPPVGTVRAGGGSASSAPSDPDEYRKWRESGGGR